MFNVEIVYADRTEVFQWPERSQAESLAAYYGRECQADPGFVAVRVRDVGEKKTSLLSSLQSIFTK